MPASDLSTAERLKSSRNADAASPVEMAATGQVVTIESSVISPVRRCKLG